jgi:predicted Zn-dependent peptidase
MRAKSSASVYKVSRLENGLTVVTAEMPHMTSASIGLWVGVGARYEPAHLNGICHFIEHMVFKGTKQRSARDISQAIEGRGGYLNAFTSEETTCFHARARFEHLPEMLDVLADMLLRPRFSPVDVSKEREVVKEEIASYLDEPQVYVQELLNSTLWPTHPLGRPITGTPETLDGMSRRTMAQYLQSNYVAGSIVVAAAGNLTHGRILKLARRYAPHFTPGNRPVCTPAASNQQAPVIKLLTRKTEQTQMAMGIRTCSRHDPRRYAIRLLNAILGENMSSRLFQVVREDNGLAYSIYSSPSFFSDAGDLVISAGLDTSKVARALRLICLELRRLRDRAPKPDELGRARDYVIGQLELGRESTESQMNWVGEQILAYGDVVPPEAIERRLCRVTPGDIQAAAREFFRPERLNLALISPLKSAQGLEKPMSL